jgi:hypothetical protein
MAATVKAGAFYDMIPHDVATILEKTPASVST